MLRIASIFFLVLFFSVNNRVDAQLSVTDSSASIFMFNPRYSLQFPGGDMKDRFYTNNSIGFGMIYKTTSNWIFSVDFNYIFAEKVRNEDEILSNITTSEGYVIDKSGVFANIHFRERGFFTGLKFGKLLPWIGPNPNSGIVVLLGVGILQHKIRIENTENTAPQIQDEYIKGYDKLTNGPGITQFIGYMNTSNNKLTNFYLGFEFTQAWTQSRRDYDFVMMAKDNKKRFDTMFGIVFGWNIPVYRRTHQQFFIN